ncbi:hypothetical protein ACFPT7_14690 [Acidicapsa dinghuensis]|uniref:MarR family transcriptional regulator n=1 Tax=Acidicapsa dinghuensis TaxID=2218256 RepID=A0ABW1EI71_9BACT|nr:hypothetical protein [Acidicapsa dinghuensis]
MAVPHRSHAVERPLTALLSYALVAFTIEFDNEAEHRLPHATTLYGRTPGALAAPWLASLAMWTNCMQHLQEGPITVAELERRARTPANLPGMVRWGYIRIQPAPSDARPKPPRSEWLITLKPGGQLAIEIWRPLQAEIEDRWRNRFGADLYSGLRQSLAAIVSRFDPALPDCMPILKFGLFCYEGRRPAKKSRVTASAQKIDPEKLPLSALLAKPLLSLAIDYETGSPVSMAIAANILRLVPDQGLRLKDLPALSGVSKESIAMAMTFLKARGMAIEAPESPGSRFRAITLTDLGRALRDEQPHRLREIEHSWEQKFGEPLKTLREQLREITGDGTAHSSPLFLGLKPYLGGWRSKALTPAVLPNFPMVLHRGGWPDGS